jgi:hypothetical protein
MDSGKGLFIEGSDFGYAMATTTLYSYFGCNYVGDGNPTYNNVKYLDGIAETIAEGIHIDYMYGTGPDWSVDIIDSNGGDIFFVCHEDLGRAISWGGQEDGYRSIHQCHLFGAMIDGENTKAEIMELYVDYLYRPVKVELSPRSTQVKRGETLVVDITVESNTATSLKAYGLVNLTLPNEKNYPLVPPKQFQLSPGQKVTPVGRHKVPAFAPLGNYSYTVIIADSTHEIYDSDTFVFEIIP